MYTHVEHPSRHTQSSSSLIAKGTGVPPPSKITSWGMFILHSVGQVSLHLKVPTDKNCVLVLNSAQIYTEALLLFSASAVCKVGAENAACTSHPDLSHQELSSGGSLRVLHSGWKAKNSVFLIDTR